MVFSIKSKVVNNTFSVVKRRKLKIGHKLYIFMVEVCF